MSVSENNIAGSVGCFDVVRDAFGSVRSAFLHQKSFRFGFFHLTVFFVVISILILFCANVRVRGASHALDANCFLILLFANGTN